MEQTPPGFKYVADFLSPAEQDALLCELGWIGKKGATYAAFFRGVTNVWGVSRSWIAAAC